MPVISLAELLESGVHFGHQTRRWNPRMSQYIYTARNGVHIIDLVQTAQLMELAYEYMRSSSERGQRVLFVGTKRQAAGIIAQEASRCGAFYVNQRWLGGMLTNWESIKTRVERLKELEHLEESGALEKRPKKEGSVLRREMRKLQKYLGGIKMMRKVPDIVVIIDQKREHNAIAECQKLGIPVVSVLDTNCDPLVADVPIPANDDAIRSIKLIVGKLADAIYEGRHGQPDNQDDYDKPQEGLDAHSEYPSAEEYVDEQEEDYEDDEESELEEEAIIENNINTQRKNDELSNNEFYRYPRIDSPNCSPVNQKFSIFVQLLIKQCNNHVSPIKIDNQNNNKENIELEIIINSPNFKIEGQASKSVKIQKKYRS